MEVLDTEPLYRAKIADRKTGESATTTEAWSRFWWLEGNGSCDCSRFMALRKALGEEPEVAEAECFDAEFPTGRYELELV